MRIIGGKFKNKKINFPKKFKTRPLKDSVRENIFNILFHSKYIDIDLKNLNVLDLYAGSGSFGIESLSRDASKVVFVEKDQDVILNLKKNIDNLNLLQNSKIISKDVIEFLNKFDFDNYSKFNLVFLDPPYKDMNFINSFKIFKNKNFLNKNHILIIHRESKFKDNLQKYTNIIENRIYGRSEIFFAKIY